MLKKIFLILIIAIFAFQLGSAVLPHSHGMDFNHSRHQDCPLYRLNIGLLADYFPLFFIIFLILSSAWILLFKENSFHGQSLKSIDSRGPPLDLLNVIFILTANLSQGECNESKFRQIKFNRDTAFNRNIYD